MKDLNWEFVMFNFFKNKKIELTNVDEKVRSTTQTILLFIMKVH